MQTDQPKLDELKGRLYPWVDEEYGPALPPWIWEIHSFDTREEADRVRELIEIERVRREWY